MSNVHFYRNIQIGYQGDPLIVHWQSAVTLAESHTLMNIEALTGYILTDLSSYYVYNPFSKQLQSDSKMTHFDDIQTDWSNYYRSFPRVFSTPDGQYAMAAVSLDQDHTSSGTNQRAAVTRYGAFVALNMSAEDMANTGKWSNTFSITNPVAGKYTFDNFIVFGTRAEVLARLIKLYGQWENRNVSGISQQFLSLASQGKGLDVQYYANTYSDLKNIFTDKNGELDTDGLVTHYLQFGIFEGRNGNANFNAINYLNRYADLQSFYGKDPIAGLKHFYSFGQSEGRNGK